MAEKEKKKYTGLDFNPCTMLMVLYLLPPLLLTWLTLR